jgi:CxxC motif-containing protein (DUF1111 family)
MHDGSSPTLEDVIEKHGGDAKHTREQYLKGISKKDRENLIAFLKALRAPPAGKPVAQIDEK